MSLRALQENIQNALIHGIADAKLDLVIESGKISAQNRLETYRTSSFLKPQSVLVDDFQVTRSFLGEDIFDDLVRDYLEKHPPNTHYINECGRYFADFLLSQLDLQKLPFLADLAGLEWLRVESFFDFFNFQKDQGPVVRKPGVIFKNCSLKKVESEWPLGEIWDLEKAKNKKQSTIYIWTTENRKVHVESWEGLQKDILETLLESVTLEEAIALVSEKHLEDDLIEIFSNQLPRWVNQGLFEIQT